MQLQNEIVKKHTPIKSLLIDWLIIFGTYLFIRIFFALFGLHQNIVLLGCCLAILPYKGVFADLKSAKTILAASNSVLMKFERPANQSAAVQNKRAAYGQKFYDKYAGKTPVVPEQKPSAVPYRVRVTADVLNIRKGAGTGYAVAGQIKGGGVYTIVEEKDGTGAKSWGKLKSGAGWISLDYTSRV